MAIGSILGKRNIMCKGREVKIRMSRGTANIFRMARPGMSVEKW